MTTSMLPPEKNTARKNVDGGWAWIVLATAFCSFAITSGLFYSFGVLYSVFLDEFNESRSTTAWIGSLNGAFFQISGPIGSVIIVKKGCRIAVMLGGVICTVGYVLSAFSMNVWHLFIFYGIIVAFGFNLVYTGLVVSLGQYFQKRYSLAMGLSMAGSGIGLLTLGPAIQALIFEFGWRDALILEGGLTLQYVIAGALLFPRTDKPLPPAQEVGLLGSQILTKPPREGNSNHIWDPRVIKDVKFWFLNCSSLFWVMGGLTMFIIIKDFAVSRGIGDTFTLALIALGMGDIVGRVLGGVVASSTRVNILFYYSLAMVACSIVILSHMTISNITGLVILSVLFGFFYGQQSVLLPLVPVNLYGADKLATTFGFILFTAGFGSLIGPPVAGWIVDQTNSYNGAFSFAGICNFQAAVCMFIVYAVDRYQNNKKTPPSILLDPEYQEESDKMVIKSDKGGVVFC